MEPRGACLHTPLESIVMHLAPGLAVAAFVFGLSWAFSGRGVPAMFWLQVGALVVAAPMMYAIMKRSAAREGAVGACDVIAYRTRLRWWEYVLWPFLALAFAGLAMTFLGRIVTPLLRTRVFGWLPASWDVADYLLRPSAYSRGWRVATWVLGLVATTVLFPAIEELYFRGFLLPRLRGGAAGAVLANAALFACYHFFTPWQVVARFVALVPFVWFIWWKKDVRIGIIAHVALNLVGDTIPSIGIVFGQG